MRRLQRFLACYVLDLDLIARMIFSLLPVKQGLVLTMDRTNWNYGKTDINVLLLGVTYKNVAFPLLFRLLPKRGNSSTTERIDIIERFIRLFGKDCIDAWLPTASSSVSNGRAISTARASATTCASGRTSGYRSLATESKSRHFGSSTT